MKTQVRQAKPVSLKGIRYEVVRGARGRGFDQNGGLIAAIDESNGQELWVLKVYDVHYDGEMEDDKQDVLITDLSASRWRNQLTIRNERGEKYVVDLNNKTVVRS
jgi:hypothetical protein